MFLYSLGTDTSPGSSHSQNMHVPMDTLYAHAYCAVHAPCQPVSNVQASTSELYGKIQEPRQVYCLDCLDCLMGTAGAQA